MNYDSQTWSQSSWFIIGNCLRRFPVRSNNWIICVLGSAHTSEEDLLYIFKVNCVALLWAIPIHIHLWPFNWLKNCFVHSRTRMIHIGMLVQVLVLQSRCRSLRGQLEDCLEVSLGNHIRPPICVHCWAYDCDYISSKKLNLIVTLVFLVFVHDYNPHHIPLKFRCSIKRNNHTPWYMDETSIWALWSQLMV